MEYETTLSKLRERERVAGAILKNEIGDRGITDDWALRLGTNGPHRVRRTVGYRSPGATRQLRNRKATVGTDHVGYRHAAVAKTHALGFQVPPGALFPGGCVDEFAGDNHVLIMPSLPPRR